LVARKLEAEGYKTWLDEHVLLVGDALGTKISQAIKDARVVIVVVSEASLGSRWLSFELNAATQRMIEGSCRLLPVLIGDVEPPSEVQGLLYADCRRGRRGGLRKILETLDFEASRYPSPRPPSLKSADSTTRWVARSLLVAEVLGPQGSASIPVSEIRSVECKFVTIEQGTGEVDILIHNVSDYINDDQPLDVDDWVDFRRLAHEEAGQPYALLLSERAPSPDLAALLHSESPCVHFAKEERSLSSAAQAAVFVDLSGRPGKKEMRRRLEAALAVLRVLTAQPQQSLLQELLDKKERSN
jgi:TIR domain